ncbi:ATP-binding protein [Streptomyces sp. KR80]|uniref:ATP-binding protein n=1 Tax=Streptomyces sp. KR80 TaxID=3457426 RepID=UPI003FD38CFA
MLTASRFPVQPAPSPRARMSSPSVPARGRSVVQWALRPTLATVPMVRARVRTVLRGWGVAPDLMDALLLAVTELVANAVQHAGTVTGRLRATVTLGGGWLQLEVADGDPSLPRAGAAVDREAESGRGLLIVGLMVAELCGELTAFPCDPGKAVRVRIPAV